MGQSILEPKQMEKCTRLRPKALAYEKEDGLDSSMKISLLPTWVPTTMIMAVGVMVQNHLLILKIQTEEDDYDKEGPGIDPDQPSNPPSDEETSPPQIVNHQEMETQSYRNQTN